MRRIVSRRVSPLLNKLTQGDKGFRGLPTNGFDPNAPISIAPLLLNQTPSSNAHRVLDVSDKFPNQIPQALEEIRLNLASLSSSSLRTTEDMMKKLQEFSEILSSMKLQSEAKKETVNPPSLSKILTEIEIGSFSRNFAESIDIKNFKKAQKLLMTIQKSFSEYVYNFLQHPEFYKNSPEFEQHKRIFGLWKETEFMLIQKIVEIANIDLLRSAIKNSSPNPLGTGPVISAMCFDAISGALRSELPEEDKRKILDMMDILVTEKCLELGAGPDYTHIINNRVMALRLLNAKDINGNSIFIEEYSQFLESAIASKQYDLAEEIARIIKKDKIKVLDPFLYVKAERLLLDMELYEAVKLGSLKEVRKIIEKFELRAEKNPIIEEDSSFEEEKLLILDEAIRRGNPRIFQEIMGNLKPLFNKRIICLSYKNFEKLFYSVNIEEICHSDKPGDIIIRKKLFSFLNFLVTKDYISPSTKILSNGKTFLHLVIQAHDQEFLGLLLEDNSLGSLRNRNYPQKTALEYAIEIGNWEAAEKIVGKIERALEQDSEVELKPEDFSAIRAVRAEKALREKEAQFPKTSKLGSKSVVESVNYYDSSRGKISFVEKIKNASVFLLASSFLAGFATLFVSKAKAEIEKNNKPQELVAQPNLPHMTEAKKGPAISQRK